ncbi:minor capsid protein [Clostridium scatologenes]|uniref:Phage head morphogenesis protein, SPP1 gp7 family n=1 Tax=Clostridium scatologenes TaxID=1548 RepID=A0A0E3MBP7_CLOSL|nr:minor capsid protein [Clostridium scatologenes]AKA71965.1 phage head morphogenesis protein, SPP1 gp7 family [Clostridium scatologenes]
MENVKDKNKSKDEKKLQKEILALFLSILAYSKKINPLLLGFKQNRDLVKNKINQLYLLYSKDGKLNMTNNEINKNLQQLKPIFKQVTQNLTLIEDNQLKELLTKVYKESYYKTSYILATGLAFSLKRITDKQVNKVINEKIDRKSAFTRNKINKTKFVNKLIKDIKYNLQKDTSMEKMFSIIDKDFNTGVFYSHRLIENQLTINFEKAQLEAYEHAGVKEVEYCAVLDARTTKLCESLDGNIYPIDEAPIPVADTHINCRSTLIPYGTEWKKQNSLTWEEYQTENQI